jgi:uncharacterized membrane protein
MSDTLSQGTPAVGFLVMAFTSETAADDALKAMKEAKKQKQLYFEDAAVIRQDSEGKVHYHETGDMHMGKGAGTGALVGGILGILGGPAGVALGASAGAAIGAAAAHGDAGFRDESLKTVGVALKPGTSAVTAITSHAFLRAVQKEVSAVDIQIFVNNLASAISRRLDEGKNVALGILLAEHMLAIKEVAVDENSTEVVGMAITDEAVVAGAAIVTADGVSYEVGIATAEGALIEQGVATAEGAVITNVLVTEQALESGEPAAETTAAESTPEAPAAESKSEESTAA